ncbi:DNA-binding protein [Actibacterium lipolyticum]|uniref:KfrA N-terminal DNA-binding domain-containing protein n=1 Tax=Actibacterium lipolyticum TaxID=1524263 RepID=A0A238JV71_9RHOB|nr:DNA-binding protein [Actibacterium lipolyticum]SMX34403.1 hypothetical protein COL8621_01292 [Actibacterium lipolyticum]
MAQKSNKSMETRVREAIKKLEEKGEDITNAKVRALTGGSFRDVSPVVKKLKAELEEKARVERATPDMPEDVLDAVTELWTLAWARADETAAAERRGHAVEIDKLKAEVVEQEEAVEIVEAERDQAEKRAEVAEAKNAELSEKLQETQLQVAELKGRLAERHSDVVQRTKASPTEIKRAKMNKAPINKEEQPDMFPSPAQSKERQPPVAAK